MANLQSVRFAPFDRQRRKGKAANGTAPSCWMPDPVQLAKRAARARRRSRFSNHTVKPETPIAVKAKLEVPHAEQVKKNTGVMGRLINRARATLGRFMGR